MQKLPALLIFLSLWLVGLAHAGKPVTIQHDENGMPRCLTWQEGNRARHHYLFWQGTRRIEVYGIDLRDISDAPRSCERWRRVDQGLIDTQQATRLTPEALERLDLELPASFQRALDQIRAGARLYRSEDSARDFLAHHPFGAFERRRLKTMQDDYGKAFTDEVYLEWIKGLGLPRDCQSLVGRCEYYLCREGQNPCGSSGYYLAFGYQYCQQSLTDLIQRVSPRGETWLTQVATCLQQGLEHEVPTATRCSEVKDRAVGGHSRCYTEANFCGLKLADILRILGMLRPELTDVQILAEGMQVLAQCLAKEET